MEKVILFATNNQNKVKELKAAFEKAGLDYEIKTDADFADMPHISENGTTFAENATIKAHTMAEFAKMPTVSDDSGLVVDKLNGAPGVHSARYGGEAHNDARNNAKLLASLGGIPQEERKAKFVSTFVVSMPGHFDKDLVITGECDGEVLAIPRGRDGFGYDPLFYVPEKKKTFAEMTTDEKNEVSHRGRALKQLMEKLPSWLEQF
ncbi:XTP/dITP diphosphatase [Lactobacillus psittaci]|uniref:dITP/XTP pyrophosphatase n=1 Tax=Lactobacillus psittaci DSM 15354 TaxID=1122152 RepID=A0A0R1S327_9LACO|nr:XTP/dITP diphosphatase [Lactobacillus psittaci]KRL63049.1 non-canonical purine NTP pyrophosphatase, RdgB HAM1 family [Lactobacillus psittaci DSM 15354]